MAVINDIRSSRRWNQYGMYSAEIGGGHPTWCEPPKRFITGGMVKNEMAYNEYLAGGSPVEYNVKTREAKILKIWKIQSATTADDATVIILSKGWDLPTIAAGTNVMLITNDFNIDDTGLSVTVSKVEDTNGYIAVTIPSTLIADASAVNGLFLAESNGAGATASLYCKPNSLTLEETIAGNQNSVGIARGHKYIYENLIPPMPDVIKNNIPDLYFDWFNEVQDSGYVTR